MQLVYHRMHYYGLTLIYITENNVWSFRGVSLNFLSKKEVYPRVRRWVHYSFLSFVNDLPLICSNSSVQLYADDTVIYTSKPHLFQIQTALQSDFNNFQ